jgi:hypothetical protein
MRPRDGGSFPCLVRFSPDSGRRPVSGGTLCVAEPEAPASYTTRGVFRNSAASGGKRSER